MKTLVRASVVLALLAAQGLASAGPRYYGHHHHHHRGPGLGGLVLGLAVAVPLIALANHAEREVVYVPPPPPPPPQPVYIQQPVQPVYTQPAPSRAVPIIYPRNGQGAHQLEADSRECNRWATTQQAAMSDASVFQRAVEACMDGRGYTMR